MAIKFYFFTPKPIHPQKISTRARRTIRATGTNFVTGLNNTIINKKKLSPIYITISLQLIDLVAGLLEIDVLQIKPTPYVKIIFDLPFYSYYTIHIS